MDALKCSAFCGGPLGAYTFISNISEVSPKKVSAQQFTCHAWVHRWVVSKNYFLPSFVWRVRAPPSLYLSYYTDCTNTLGLMKVVDSSGGGGGDTVCILDIYALCMMWHLAEQGGRHERPRVPYHIPAIIMVVFVRVALQFIKKKEHL